MRHKHLEKRLYHDSHKSKGNHFFVPSLDLRSKTLDDFSPLKFWWWEDGRKKGLFGRRASARWEEEGGVEVHFIWRQPPPRLPLSVAGCSLTLPWKAFLSRAALWAGLLGAPATNSCSGRDLHFYEAKAFPAAQEKVWKATPSQLAGSSRRKGNYMVLLASQVRTKPRRGNPFWNIRSSRPPSPRRRRRRRIIGLS